MLSLRVARLWAQRQWILRVGKMRLAAAMMAVSTVAAALLVGLVDMVISTGAALAGTGQPTNYQYGFQGSVTAIFDQMHDFHTLLMWIITIVTLFVMLLLLYVIVRFNRRSNPVPSRNTHHTMLEVAWTVLPIFILVIIAIPSFKLLYAQYEFPKADVTIKAIANQWYWDYEYPDQDVSFSAYMVTDEQLLKANLSDTEFSKRFGSLEGIARGEAMREDAHPLWVKNDMVRLMSVDNDIVVPVGKVVHVLVQANDVIHNWTVPSFGSKVDAVPGRVTATWFKAEKEGVYYGQCSELCGINHAFMPIAVRVVSDSVYNQWVGIRKAGTDADNKARALLKQATAELKARGDKAVAALAAPTQ